MVDNKEQRHGFGAVGYHLVSRWWPWFRKDGSVVGLATEAPELARAKVIHGC